MNKFIMLLGRICISLIFVTSAVTKLFTWNETLTYMTGALNKFISNIPVHSFAEPVTLFITTHTVFLLVLATIFEGVGGLFVLLGFKVRFGATLLILFLAPMTMIMHAFWLYSGNDHVQQSFHFMKNLAILGGLFILSAKSGGASES